ncbi:MAG: hypothetical protein Q8L65_15675 [Burkholderiales bacterium]|nr:hypothetical protein [Burkholderiales bacterium]MDP2398505.1 hypothetical protein [Burkholderiales bacterium]
MARHLDCSYAPSRILYSIKHIGRKGESCFTHTSRDEARKGVIALQESRGAVTVLEVVLPLDSSLPAHPEWKVAHKLVYRILPVIR